MEIRKLVEKLESSEEYKEWIKNNNDFYLVHLFFMTNQPPQIGYYQKKRDQVVTFDLADQIVINPASEVIKQNKTIERLELLKIKIDKAKALDVVKNVKKTKYPKEMIDKEIVLIQQLSGQPLYNVTFFTKTFNTLNVKLNAENGHVISHDLASLVDFQK